MKFLLDTNVISEWVKPEPNVNVIDWMMETDEDRVYLSVVSFAEVRRGIELLGPGRRRTRLSDWLSNDLQFRFEGRILPVDLAIAHAWGSCSVKAQKLGIVLGTMDAFFAATAIVHELILVTRNTQDFSGLGIQLFDPWIREP